MLTMSRVAEKTEMDARVESVLNMCMQFDIYGAKRQPRHSPPSCIINSVESDNRPNGIFQAGFCRTARQACVHNGV